MRLLNLKSLVFFLAIGIGAQPVIAQQLYFSTLSVKDGLPSNIISAIAQDPNDFIWVGTSNGLARYDGYNFKIFNKTSSHNSLSSNEISCVLQEGEELWVGTWSGLCKINTRTFEISRITALGNNAVRTLAKGSAGKIWVGTENGLLQVDASTNSVLKTYHENNSGLSHNTIRSIYEGLDGTLWVGTYDKLNKLAPGGGLFQSFNLKDVYKTNLKNNLICGEIKPDRVNSDSLLWVGTETGLARFNTTNQQFELWGDQHTELSNEVIKCVYLGQGGKVWLGTDFGLNIFDPVTKKVETYFHNPQVPYSLANNAIWQIFEDRSGVIWFVTSNGLSRLNKHPNAYQYHEVVGRVENKIVGNQVKSILVAKNNSVWLATLHGVICLETPTQPVRIFDTNSKASQKILLNNVYALAEDASNRIWIGTAGGINIWDESNQKMYAITANPTNGLITNYIARIIRGPDNTMWVSTYQGGLFKTLGDLKNLEQLRFQRVSDEFGSEKIVAGAEALWFVMYNDLYRLDLKTGKQEKIETADLEGAKNDIHGLFFSAQNKLWAGTQNGLIEYDPQKKKSSFHAISTGRNVLINSLSEDEAGNIWGTTNHFVFRYSPSARATELFPLDQNLPLKSFYSGCSARNSQGQLLFGGDNGYITIQTNHTQLPSYQPKVYITSLAINNKAINQGDTIGHHVFDQDISITTHLPLDFAHRSIALQFSSLHYWQPHTNIYAYKLEGFDDDWIYTSGQRNFAIYSNLSPGNYTFRLRGSNNYGQWSNQEATLIINVNPPLFLSPAFLILYGIVVLTAIAIGMRMYSTRLKLKNELKIARLEKQHGEALIQARQQFFTNISHELRTPVSLIMPPIQQLLKDGTLDATSRSLISLAEKNSHRLLRVINQILDFRKLENDRLEIKVSRSNLVSFTQEIHTLFTDKAQRKKIDYHFHAGLQELPVWMDSEKIETVLFNLLSNAFKFTPQGGTINVNIKQGSASEGFPDGSAIIEISDSGIGLNALEKEKIFQPFYQTDEARLMESGTGIGLALAAEYIKLHYGQIQVESVKGKGTTFVVQLPLGKHHLPVDAIHEEQEIELVATKAPTHLSQKAYRLNLQSNKPLVLLIDDSADMIEFVQISLAHKYNFITAENGEEGLKKTSSFLPEVIISDVMMPVMDGITFCKKIKENSSTSHIGIILITARTLVTQQAEGIRVGADVYITKPFDIDLLEAHIDHLLARKQELTNYLKQVLHAPPITTNKENEDEKFVKKVMNVIEANISDPGFGVEQLSEEIGMSASYLYRKLKSLTQLSTNDIIKKYRLKKAAILLRNKGGNVTEIMYEVGFANLSYFSKCFKAEYGLNPKDYQQQLSKSSVDLNL
jgi:signal transduction histidine kinase/ligand-binding sensor domain-containing protein/CheY-like chemotaxis protein/AraC-like DNA-binding protein